MAKIIKSGGYITVVYSDGYTVTQPEESNDELFVQAYLYQDDEEYLETLFPRNREKSEETKQKDKNKLDKINELYRKKKGSNDE